MEKTAAELLRSWMNSLRKNPKLFDATIVVPGNTFPIHSVIIADISPVFKKALFENVKEGKRKVINLKGSSAQAVKFILDYAYVICKSEQLSDFRVSHDVLKATFLSRIDGLRLSTFSFAVNKYSRRDH